MKDPSYRLAVRPSNDLRILPDIQFETYGEGNITQQFNIFDCATASGLIVPLIPCGRAPTPQKCLVTSGLVRATPTNNKLTCILETDPTDVNFLVRVSAADTSSREHLATYVHASDNVKVYLDTFNVQSGSNVQTFHSFRHVYTTLERQPGAVQIEIIVTSIEGVHSWIKWLPFSGWEALGTLGGIVFFNYLFHSIIMRVVALFYPNPWDPAQRMTQNRETERLLPYRELPDVVTAAKDPEADMAS